MSNRPLVLLVDDEKTNLKVLSELLKDVVKIALANNGPQELDKALLLKPDLILLDVIMKGMDGFEVIKSLKANRETQAIPVIFITGLSSAEQEEQGLSLGAQDYIYKPFIPKVVKARVATQLKLVQQTRQLQHLMQQEKMASLGTLTAGVAHEINNPTNFVHVGTENLEVDLIRFKNFIFDLLSDEADETISDCFDEQFDILYKHINIIKTGTRRIKTIVQDLLDFTHLDSADKKPVDITLCIQSTINLVRTKYLEVAQFTTDFRSPPELYGFPTQLSQVFMNLFVNSCEAILEKQKKQKSDKVGKVAIVCQYTDKLLTVSVQDDGCGMDEMTQNKVFEPFFTTRGVGTGTGLGMSISFGIIKDHGGTIKVESNLNIGTNITISLPITVEEPRSLSENRASAEGKSV
jgi:signal transduction histidine kinase